MWENVGMKLEYSILMSYVENSLWSPFDKMKSFVEIRKAVGIQDL